MAGIPKSVVSALREHIATYVQGKPGAGFKDLMARMGHDNVRATMIYQHAVRGATGRTDAIDRHLEKRDDGDIDEMPAG
ncbi:hypothetical protein ACIBF6_32265 [Streptosporangium amethystogenes]|uniref:hypothetical protein n=1 Tax=Streptosporangium amethystogenes TaxID=2002 RepID=UPI00378CEBC3